MPSTRCSRLSGGPTAWKLVPGMAHPSRPLRARDTTYLFTAGTGYRALVGQAVSPAHQAFRERRPIPDYL